MDEESKRTRSDPEAVPARADGPYGPATYLVRRFLVSLSSLSARDWIVISHGYRRRLPLKEMTRADSALARAVDRGALEDARDAVVGPVLQLAQRAEAGSEGAAEAAGLDAEALAEAALAGALALIASPLLTEREVRELYSHLEPVIPRSGLS